MKYNKNFKLRVINCSNERLMTTNKIIQIFDVSNGSIFNWKNKYNANNLDNIKRKSKIKPHIKCYIRLYVINRINFNYKNLIKLIKRKFNLLISKSSIYNILKQMNIRKKKIYQLQILTNKYKRKQQIKIFKKQLRGKSLDEIISIDETSVDSYIDNKYGWSAKGKKIKIIKKFKRIRYTVICAVNCNQVIHTKIINNSANANIFTDFFKELVMKLQLNKKFYVILDNARIHHSKIFKKYIGEIDNINLIYNVPYSPESN